MATQRYESIEFRFLEWGDDDDGDDERWHCYCFSIVDDGSAYAEVIIVEWDEAESFFRLCLDGGGYGSRFHFRIEHIEGDWDKAVQVVEHFRKALNSAGCECGEVVKEIREEFEDYIN